LTVDFNDYADFVDGWLSHDLKISVYYDQLLPKSGKSLNPMNQGSDKSPGPCPAGGAHQLTVPFGLIVIVGYQYRMYNTRYPEKQG